MRKVSVTRKMYAVAVFVSVTSYFSFLELPQLKSSSLHDSPAPLSSYDPEDGTPENTADNNTRSNQTETGAVRSCKYRQGSKTFQLPQTPTFINAGAQKSGTTSLFSYFSSHPQIIGSIERENHFFDWDLPRILKKAETHWRLRENEQWCKIRGEYFEYWPTKKLLLQSEKEENSDTDLHQDPHAALYTFEKTPSYLHTFNAPVHLKKTCPWIPKVVIMLRDPVDRAYSQYLMSKRVRVGLNFTFEEAIMEELKVLRRMHLTTAPIVQLPVASSSSSASSSSLLLPFDHMTRESRWDNNLQFKRKEEHILLRKGLYAPQLRRWFQEYPRDAIMVIDYRDLQRNTSEVYYRILDWVGIPRDVRKRGSFRKENGSRPTAEPISNDTRAYLRSFFAPFNAQVEEILGEEWKGAWTADW